MKAYLILMEKGFIIGLGKILPGVSGGMLAISMGLYEQIIHAISYLFHDFKNHFRFLFVLGIGAIISITSASNVIKEALDHFYFPTMMLFIGLILGGIPGILKKVVKFSFRRFILMIVMFFIILGVTLLGGSHKELLFDWDILSFFVLMGIGIIDAATMVIPGISGTAILMMIGFYPTFILCLGTIFQIKMLPYNIMIMLPFGIGMVLGVFILSRMVDYLFRHYKDDTYSAIVGFALSSIVSLFIQMLSNSSMIFGWSGILFFLVGCFLGYVFDK